MRVLPGLAVVAIALVPVGTIADPATSQTAPAAAAQTAPPQTSGAQPPAEPAVDAPTAPAAPATAAASSAGPDQIVCKDMPPKTGSRLGGGRECHTQRQWNRMQAESQELTRRQERTGYSGP
jgi:hypothetical protein